MITSEKKKIVYINNILTLFRGSNKKKESLIWRLFLLGSLWVSTEDRHQLIVGQSQRNATKCGPNNEEPQAVARCMGKDTHRNCSEKWLYVPIYIYTRRLYAYKQIHWINSKTVSWFMPIHAYESMSVNFLYISTIWSIMINYVDYILLGNAWTSLKKYRKSGKHFPTTCSVVSDVHWS